MLERKEIEAIGEAYDLAFIVTFGSYGTPRFTNESDIDIAFQPTRVLDQQEEEKLMIDMILYFRRDKLDLINLRTAPILLKNEVATNGRVLYDKEQAFTRFKSKVFKLFQEMKPMLDQRVEAISRQIEAMK